MLHNTLYVMLYDTCNAMLCLKTHNELCYITCYAILYNT